MLGSPHIRRTEGARVRDPWAERDQLMRDVCFIADVAVLPALDAGSQAFDYVAACTRDSIASRPKAFWRRPTSATPASPGIIEGHGDPTPPRSGHGHRREIAGLDEPDAWP